MTGYKKVYFDVMFKGRFVFQLEYLYCPLFKINMDDIFGKIYEKRPTLKGKNIEIHQTLNVVR